MTPLAGNARQGLSELPILLDLAVGGAERDRTADLLIANEALSQLSYGPNRGRAAFPASSSQ